MYKGRIARFDEPGKPFEIETVSLPEVSPGEILIKVSRANICGSDLHAWHGTTPQMSRSTSSTSPPAQT